MKKIISLLLSLIMVFGMFSTANAANELADAKNYELGTNKNSKITENNKSDIYKFTLSTSGVLKLSTQADFEYIYFKVYDMDGNDIYSHCEHWNSTLESLKCEKNIELTSGTYYISFEGIHNGYYGEYFGKYLFYISTGGKIVTAPLPPSGINVLVNSNKINFDQPPVLENGRTLVPLRAIFEALGADVRWDGNSQTVTATKGGTQISLQIDSTRMYVNGSIKTLDVPAKLLNSRTLVPVRAISEAFGCKVDWIQDTQTVVITQ